VGRRARSSETGEDRLIARFFKPLARTPGAYGLTDDVAVFRPPRGHDLVLTTDAIVGGVHFFPDDPADTVARKALRVNLSDLAAKGAIPAGFLLTLALPKAVGERWLKLFARGLSADAKRFGCPLLGGDTVRTPGPTTVSITAFGKVPSKLMVRRAGAKPGDHVFVSGTIGDAALGLKLRNDPDAARRLKLDRKMRDHLADRYLLPQPRNALANAVRKYASAAMDVSDGLAGDLAKLCRVSGVGGEVDVVRIPLSPAARAAVASDPSLITTALSGGDDYEILATVPPGKAGKFRAAARAARVPVTEIGRIERGTGTRIFSEDGRVLAFDRASFSHF
jgi:thiamine-monophosphate kinase